MTDIRDQLRAEIERFGIVPVLREVEKVILGLSGSADPAIRERAALAGMSIERAIEIFEGRHRSIFGNRTADIPLNFQREGEGRK